MAEAAKTKVIKKKVPNGVLYTDGTIRIDNVRFSHPHIDKPYKGKNDADNAIPKYSVTGLLGKKTHREVVTQLIVPRINELLKENKVERLAKDKKFCRDGDDGDKKEALNHWTVSARDDRHPAVRGASKEKISDPTVIRDLFQGGHWGTILIRPWFQKNDFGTRVNAGLSAIQFVRKDETFGEGGVTDEEVDDVFEEHDDEEGGGFDDGDDGLGGDDDDDMGGL